MKKTLFLLFISIVLSACCTKKDCSSQEPEFSLVVKGFNKEIAVERFFDEQLESKETYVFSEDTTLIFDIRKDLFVFESFKISLGDSVVVLDDFVVEVTGTEEVECNKCFLASGIEQINILNVLEFKSNSVVQKQNYFEIRF